MREEKDKQEERENGSRGEETRGEAEGWWEDGSKACREKAGTTPLRPTVRL